MFKDSIADLITRIKNAYASIHHEGVIVSYSNINAEILSILKQEGYILDFEKIEKPKSNIRYFKVHLKFDGTTAALTDIKQISKPGLRIYSESNKIPKVQNGLGISIISTSKGLMTDKNARMNNLGGEIIMNVW